MSFEECWRASLWIALAATTAIITQGCAAIDDEGADEEVGEASEAIEACELLRTERSEEVCTRSPYTSRIVTVKVYDCGVKERRRTFKGRCAAM